MFGSKSILTVAATAFCLLAAAPLAVATQDAKPKPIAKAKAKKRKPKDFIKELRTAVKWMDKNPKIVSGWLRWRKVIKVSYRL